MYTIILGLDLTLSTMWVWLTHCFFFVFFLMKGFVLVVLNWPAVLKVKLLILEATTNKNASGMLKLRATPVQWPPKKSFRTILKVC